MDRPERQTSQQSAATSGPQTGQGKTWKCGKKKSHKFFTLCYKLNEVFYIKWVMKKDWKILTKMMLFFKNTITI